MRTHSRLVCVWHRKTSIISPTFHIVSYCWFFFVPFFADRVCASLLQRDHALVQLG